MTQKVQKAIIRQRFPGASLKIRQTTQKNKPQKNAGRNNSTKTTKLANITR